MNEATLLSPEVVKIVGMICYGLVLGLGAIGSALGTSAAGQAAAGCWEKEGRLDRKLQFPYLIFVAAPLSQTLYAFIMMNKMKGAIGSAGDMTAIQAFILLGVAFGGGLAQWFSAWGQGKVGAASCRALCNNNAKGLAFMIIAIGVVETVGLFAMVFLGGIVTYAFAVAPEVAEVVEAVVPAL